MLLLVCAGVQLALGSSVAASALTLGIYASHGHTHSLALQSDGDHVDLVLSHAGRESHPRDHGPGDHVHPVSLSEADHVVHIAAGDTANAAARRALPDLAPALAVLVAAPALETPQRSPHVSFDPRPTGVEHLRTVVLRL